MSLRPTTEVDLAIIGSGGAAFAAAIRATSLGRRVVMIERSTVGGTCVNTGCVPSKALLAAAEARDVAVHAGRFPGIRASAEPVDMSALIGGKTALVDGMRSEKYVDLIAEYGWGLVKGSARFAGTAEDPALTVTDPDGGEAAVRAAHYLIATGSTPWVPAIEGLRDVGYLTSTTAMELSEVPESLLILGGGPVAIEMAQLFSRLGSAVTMLVRSRLASSEEPEVAHALGAVFADDGIRVVNSAALTSLRPDASTGEVLATATVSGAREEFRAAKLLIATGRRPVTGGLHLDAVGVRVGQRSEVLVTDELVTSNRRIWAAGDVTGHPEYVYVAAAHGTLVAENALGGAGRKVDYGHLPRIIFSSPTMAAVGMTERQASESGIRCRCRVVPLEYVPRAIVDRDTRGFIKMVAEVGTGRILGLTAVAQGAAELAAAGVYILEVGLTVDRVGTLWSPYLTMAEGIKITAQSFSTDIRKLSCCAA